MLVRYPAMTTDAFIAVGLAVAITALLAWVGDWAGVRRKRQIERRLAACACPRCGAAYGLEAVRAGNVVFLDVDPVTPDRSGGESRVITCARCEAVREWHESGRLSGELPDNPPMHRTGPAV